MDTYGLGIHVTPVGWKVTYFGTELIRGGRWSKQTTAGPRRYRAADTDRCLKAMSKLANAAMEKLRATKPGRLPIKLMKIIGKVDYERGKDKPTRSTAW